MKEIAANGGSMVERLRSLNAAEIQEIERIWHEARAELTITAFYKCQSLDEWKRYLESNPPSAETIALLIVMAVEKHKSRVGRTAANAMHSKSGASRDKRQIIRDAWAGGTYASRDICAEQECGAIPMSLSIARKALRNTPDPDPWPAKPTKKPTKPNKQG